MVKSISMLTNMQTILLRTRLNILPPFPLIFKKHTWLAPMKTNIKERIKWVKAVI